MVRFLQERRKAIAVLVTAAVLAGINYAGSGELDTTELGIALTGLLAAPIVEQTPNKPKRRRRG